jgi:hypothetical protein
MQGCSCAHLERVGMFMSIRFGHCFPRRIQNTSARKIDQTKMHEDAKKCRSARKMQDDAQNILLEIKHDIMDGQTFFPFFFEKDRMGNAETYSHAKNSLKKFSQKTRP